MRLGVLAILLGASLLACGDNATTKVTPDQCVQIDRDFYMADNRAVDILFVVDTSSSMADEQATLAANVGRFVQVLETIEGGVPDVHIGVISADMGAGGHPVSGCSGAGDGGKLQSAPRVPDCVPPTDAYISDVRLRNGERERNYTGTLTDTLACIARLGAGGCDVPQPLEAVRRALDPQTDLNPGFLRDHASLVVVVLTDGDDCSVSDSDLFDPANTALGPASAFRCFEQGVVCSPDDPRTAGTKSDCLPRDDSAYVQKVDEYAAFLRGLEPDPNRVAVSIVSGGLAPVSVSVDADGAPTLDAACTSDAGQAGPAPRLDSFAEAFRQRATRVSMCAADQSDALSPIGTLLARTLGVPCVDGEIDLDPDTPGLQVDCVVSEVGFPGDTPVAEQLLPQCSSDDPGADEQPCWLFVVDENLCAETATNARFEVVPRPTYSPPATYMQVRCLGACSLESEPTE